MDRSRYKTKARDAQGAHKIKTDAHLNFSQANSKSEGILLRINLLDAVVEVNRNENRICTAAVRACSVRACSVRACSVIIKRVCS